MAETAERDQPLTPASRLFLQPLTEQVINVAIAFENPIDEIQNSIMLKHPGFCSLIVRDSCGLEHWCKTHVNVDRHFIIHHHSLSSVNDYIADLSVSTTLPTDKPLCEFHLHADGDGIPLMSMLLSRCRRVDDLSQTPECGGGIVCGGSAEEEVVVDCLDFVEDDLLYFGLCFGVWVEDVVAEGYKTTVISGGSGVELWPRKLVTARFRIDHMEIVKR